MAAMERLEGRLSILAALQAHQRRFQIVLIRRDAHLEKLAELVAQAEARGVPVRYVEEAELDALTHGHTHGGVVALCGPKPRTSNDSLLELVRRLRTPPLLLLLEGVDDARNLGYVLRSAEAFGAHAVLIKKHLWNYDPVEVSRPSAGAYERLPLTLVEDLGVIHELKKSGLRLLGCLAAAKRSLYDRDLRRPTILALGGEKRGLSAAVRKICDRFVSILTVAGASLSLSHAAAVCLGEAARQRGEVSGTRANVQT